MPPCNRGARVVPRSLRLPAVTDLALKTQLKQLLEAWNKDDTGRWPIFRSRMLTIC